MLFTYIRKCQFSRLFFSFIFGLFYSVVLSIQRQKIPKMSFACCRRIIQFLTCLKQNKSVLLYLFSIFNPTLKSKLAKHLWKFYCSAIINFSRHVRFRFRHEIKWNKYINLNCNKIVMRTTPFSSNTEKMLCAVFLQ